MDNNIHEVDSIEASTKYNAWYYELRGEQKGPIASEEIIELIKEKEISSDTLVWCKGMTNWKAIIDTEFRMYFQDTPPPLMGDTVSNTVVWWLAFAPIIGLIIENIIAGTYNLNIGDLWYVTLIINIILCSLDEKKLNKAGHDTKKMGAVWLVPVYLFKRAKVLKQKSTYAVIWCLMFAIMLFAPSMILDNPSLNFGTGNSTAINMVQEGRLDLYPDVTLGDMIDGFFENPKWSSIIADDGNRYINVEGKILFDGRTKNVAIQYQLDTSSGRFEFHALEIDDIPQNILVYFGLIESMYENKR
ncbi:MAG: DUF4339 domain-containing protein [Clostridiaceae bacterium]|nr:DUF4339 domain-containing protein [Clostridiaceae bacterium]